ncbi:DUF2515 domain-containing protein [Neobacillus soli]|uniref:DUF2515 domain-containing protein n=1 Tax=Neobacillus soli TaxID=220688 RepID=UPI000825F968|nr:DUF2515 domain-containing protein [Neobacillus soli]
MFFTRNREKTPLESITEELKKKSKFPTVVPKPSKIERMLVGQITSKTREHNLNNVTRTKAYLEFYLRHPEVQWAFLGHMVSRNGGWNMTDLKGEFLTRLVPKKERNLFFSFLERGNWLIFQDVYPQFLIYEESLKQQKPLFHLFSDLNISTFMETIWNHFWRNQDIYILTIAMVINEQWYLEKRVIQNPLYQKEVLYKFEFILQDWLSFNHILFPFGSRNLVGQTLHQFESLKERILLGKRLYTVLFKNKEVFNESVKWAKSHPHTGSRKDYWPHLFNNVNEGIPGFAYQLRLKSCQLREGARKIYSPTLENAWKNVSQKEAEKGDWFEDWRVVEYLTDDDENIDGEIKNEYCKTLERLELAALAKKAITF